MVLANFYFKVHAVPTRPLQTITNATTKPNPRTTRLSMQSSQKPVESTLVFSSQARQILPSQSAKNRSVANTELSMEV
jgi:hypothetical protein